MPKYYEANLSVVAKFSKKVNKFFFSHMHPLTVK
jgi:hypothetical protein